MRKINNATGKKIKKLQILLLIYKTGKILKMIINLQQLIFSKRMSVCKLLIVK